MQSDSQIPHYRDQLQAELSRRKMLNSHYSLRSFAKTIGVSVGFLSKILKGEKDLSVDTALSVAEKLGYNAGEMAQFCQSVQIAKTDNPRLKAALVNGALPPHEKDSEYHLLDLDAFQIISDWYHYAILELSVCRSGKRAEEFTAHFVAQRLGITVEVAMAAMNRLIKSGLLEKRNGRWTKSKKFLSVSSAVNSQPSRAIRNFHLQMIEKAKAAVETQPTDLRDISGITIPLSLDKIDLARKEIKAFRRRMAKILDSSHATQVYQLNLQFFALTDLAPSQNAIKGAKK